jgi:hypothetical protein
MVYTIGAVQMTCQLIQARVTLFISVQNLVLDQILSLNVDMILSYADKHKYLGIVLHEHVDFNVTERVVAQSASRALGLLIAKFKLVGGVPHSIFTKLYVSAVWPVIAFGASLRGHKSYPCINAVHNRAMRFFLGVGKYAPNVTVSGDMG